jgi:hypothetical protein
VSVGVVELALGGVAEAVHGSADGLEGSLGAGRVVLVRVELQRQLAVGLLDLGVRGALGYPQHLVVTLLRQRYYLLRARLLLRSEIPF